MRKLTLKNLTRLILVCVMGVCFGLPGLAVAAEEKSSTQSITQLELAQMFVHVMGLSRFVPSPASPQDVFGVLLESGIFPAGGWNENATVNQSVLACLLVQALGAGDAISGPDDSEGCMAWLLENGISFDTIGEGVGNLGPTGDPVASLVFDAGLGTDPLKS